MAPFSQSYVGRDSTGVMDGIGQHRERGFMFVRQ